MAMIFFFEEARQILWKFYVKKEKQSAVPFDREFLEQFRKYFAHKQEIFVSNRSVPSEN